MTEQLWTHNTAGVGMDRAVPVVVRREGINDDDLTNWHPTTYDEQMAYETYWNAQDDQPTERSATK